MAPSVVLLEDDAFSISVTRIGERRAGQTCRLTIALNGEEALSYLEEGGAGAPRSAVIDLTAPEGLSAPLMAALRTRPWLHSDTPVIAYAERARPREPRQVGYMIKNRPVNELILAIRDTLDIGDRLD